MKSSLYSIFLAAVVCMAAAMPNGFIRGEEGDDAGGGDDIIAKRLAAELKVEEDGEGEAEAALAPGSILDTRSLWRIRTVRESPEVVGPDGKIVHGTVAHNLPGRIATWFSQHPDKGHLPKENMVVKPAAPAQVWRLPSDTPDDWMAEDFDDGVWARTRGPVFANFFSEDHEWKLILMRGHFWVPDPATAGDLSLSVDFRGGAVVYLNGAEVARAHMPKGTVTPATPAEPYPLSAYLTADGFALPWGRQTTRRTLAARPQDVKDRVAGRTRSLRNIEIPGARLKRGGNVLAIAIHRAPLAAEYFVCRHKDSTRMSPDSQWTQLGLVRVSLLSAPGSSVVPNVGPAADAGFAVWNHNSIQHVTVNDYPEPAASLRPLKIAAVRNASFSAQVVVGDGTPLRQLQVTASDLRGPGTIPAAAVQVRYGLPDGRDGQVFDSLEEFPPEVVPVSEASGRAVQPLWITVHAPRDAPAGVYEGALKITAAGGKTASVPLAVSVHGWDMPPPHRFTACMDFLQSPDTVALAYDVPLWSDAHLQLLDKSFALLGAMANKTLFVTAIRRTQMGNEHAMVRWIRDEEGELRPDFAIVEKYLDVAMKHMGRMPGVILYCWEPPESQGHAGGAGRIGRVYDKPILYSLYDPEAGEYSERRGPEWGTPEARVFWKKVTDGIQPVLKKRGLENSLLFGLAGDARPTKLAMDDICNAFPGARWAIHSHYACYEWQGYPMGMLTALWGLGYSPADPEEGYSFGWSNPQWVSYYPREMSLNSRLTEYRCKLEAFIGARRGKEFLSLGKGPRGLGRLGADFWVVLRDAQGRPRNTLASRYPEAAWGQLNINFGVPRVLGRGKHGPLATVRSEAFREAVQEIEARVYVEKALLDDAAPQLLGEALIRRCRAALDERIRFANRNAVYRGAGEAEIWFISSGWRDRAQLLFALAAEIKEKYGAREPQPNLDAKAAGG